MRHKLVITHTEPGMPTRRNILITHAAAIVAGRLGTDTLAPPSATVASPTAEAIDVKVVEGTLRGKSITANESSVDAKEELDKVLLGDGINIRNNVCTVDLKFEKKNVEMVLQFRLLQRCQLELRF